MSMGRAVDPDGVLGRAKLLVAVLVLAVACAPAATRVTLQPGAAVTPEQRLALWQGPRVDTLHAIQVGDSTLSGVPAAQPILCDSCRVTLPLVTVDSILELPPERSRFAPAAVAAAAVVGFAGIWMWSD
jgi:hypothetical protein